MTPLARLHPADLDALADLIAARLCGAGRREEGPDPGAGPRAPQASRDTPGALLTAAQVAARFGVKAEWVRDHAAELGAIRLGDGPRPRLRFIPDRVAEALAAAAPCEAGRRSGTPAPQVRPGEPARPRRRRTPPGAQSVPQLLPIRGRDA